MSHILRLLTEHMDIDIGYYFHITTVSNELFKSDDKSMWLFKMIAQLVNDRLK